MEGLRLKFEPIKKGSNTGVLIGIIYHSDSDEVIFAIGLGIITLSITYTKR